MNFLEKIFINTHELFMRPGPIINIKRKSIFIYFYISVGTVVLFFLPVEERGPRSPKLTQILSLYSDRLIRLKTDSNSIFKLLQGICSKREREMLKILNWSILMSKFVLTFKSQCNFGAILRLNGSACLFLIHVCKLFQF